MVEDPEEKRLEKLSDWELNKQLTWAVVFLTTILGLLGLLGTNIINNWIDFSKFPFITINFLKIPFVIIFLLLLIFGVDLGFYRIMNSMVRIANWQERFQDKLYHEELITKGYSQLYLFFIRCASDNNFILRTCRVFSIIILGDMLLIWALISI